jgi:hypothetical protein
MCFLQLVDFTTWRWTKTLLTHELSVTHYFSCISHVLSVQEGEEITVLATPHRRNITHANYPATTDNGIGNVIYNPFSIARAIG